MNFKEYFIEEYKTKHTWLDAIELLYYWETKEALHSDVFKEVYGPDRIGYDGKPEIPTYKSVAEDINLTYEYDLHPISGMLDSLNSGDDSVEDIQWKGNYDSNTNNILLFIGQFFKDYRKEHPDLSKTTLEKLLKDLLSWAEANPKTIKQAVVDATYSDIKPKTKETFGGMLSEL